MLRITKILIQLMACGIIIFTIIQFRSIKLHFSVLRLNSRFLLQKGLNPLTHHSASTTETNDPELFVDKSPSLSKDKLVEDVQQRMPNFPIVYWNKYKNKPMGLNNTCARFPRMFDVEYNVYWQTLRTSNGTFQLFGAFLDKRANNRLGPTVRILGMIDRIEPTVVTYCQFWFDGKKEPVITKSFEYKYIWDKRWGNYKQGIYQPYLTACVIPPQFKEEIPQSISLVEKACDNSTNNLRVIFEKAKEKKVFAVCVKGLDFLHQDVSVRLIEWIELLNLLGADKVFFYELQIHPNISKVLKHYEQEGKVHVTPINLAGGQPNVPFFQHLYLESKIDRKRQDELISYNDCFYKHMYQYKYIALLDIDEVIMPLEGTTWKGLMEKVLPKALKINEKERAAYIVRNLYFLDNFPHKHGWFKEIPKYMHMLQHVYRAKNFTKRFVNEKCFYNTEKVLTLHNHRALSCLGGGCTTYFVETGDAQLQHYRAGRREEIGKSSEELRKASVMDTTIWKFKEPLLRRVSSALRTLGYFANQENESKETK